MPTIAAIATPPGSGGIAIVRISGPQAQDLLSRIFSRSRSGNFIPWKLCHGKVVDEKGESIDEALAVYMPGPRTFTGEDIAELHCHGGQLIAGLVLERALRLGARQAPPGEFTKRAFLNGRIDLSQAEAVAEIIAAPSRHALNFGLSRLEGLLGRHVSALRAELDDLRSLACVGLDFPDDEVPPLENAAFLARLKTILNSIQPLIASRSRARLMEKGALVVLAGPVNAGKSSLFNALSGSNRALVTDIPGTTRDYLEAGINIAGIPICLVDTAGIRENAEKIEAMGMEKSRDLLATADLALFVLDSAATSDPEAESLAKLRNGKPAILVCNKMDLGSPSSIPAWAASLPVCHTSAITGENLDALAQMIAESFLARYAAVPENGLAPNERQAIALENASREIQELIEDLENGQLHDLCLARLDTVSAILGEIVGEATHDDLLDKIFSRFCIGK